MDYNSYFVTELLGTDLHRLLQSRPLEKQFIQYFLYQILASHQSEFITCRHALTHSLLVYLIERSQVCAFCWRHPS